jgi:hypothetical protein
VGVRLQQEQQQQQPAVRSTLRLREAYWMVQWGQGCRWAAWQSSLAVVGSAS